MKNYQPFALILVLSTISISCLAFAATQVPDMFDGPTAPGLVPATLDIVIGASVPVIRVNNDWNYYQNTDLNFTLSYPPGWQAISLDAAAGVGLYPPESNPDYPTPMIKIEWLDVFYSPDQPIERTDSQVDLVEISGITGRQYQDSEFILPTQSRYIELPYRDGVLFFMTSIGPAVDLGPQFEEILKTLVLP